MKFAAVFGLISMLVLTSPASADGKVIMNELARLEGVDFEVSGVLIAEDYMGQDYRLSVPDLGDFPTIIDGGRELRRLVEENCMFAEGCEVTVTGQLEFDLPMVVFSIGGAKTVAMRDALDTPTSALKACWNVALLSRDELKESVTIAFEVVAGRPDTDSIRYVRGSKSEREIRGLYETARRAVIRCGSVGSSFTDGTTEVTFDASSLEIR